MTTAATTPASPKLDAEQVLTRLLNVIRNSKSTREITSEHLSKEMGVDFVTYEPGHHAFGEELSPKWAYGMELYDSTTPIRSHRFSFSFNSDPGAPPSMAGLCKPDFDQFTAELEAMGFTRNSYYDSPPQPPPGEPALPHGSWMYDYFDHPGMRIDVYPQWTLPSSPEQGGRNCVKMVLIR